MELWQFLGTMHPKLVQIPLMMLLAGLVFDALGVIRKSEKARWAGLACTGMGTIGLLFAFICGIYAEIWAARAGVPQHPIELHELMANIASWGFVILFAWRILLTETSQNAEAGIPQRKYRSRRRGMKAYLAVGFCWYLLLVTTGYLGGQLVFQYGAGMTGALASGSGLITVEDLNTLASRQTDLNLRYSEWMHHIFGWMTLGLGVSLLAQALWPAKRRKLTWIVPMFLLIGGIFLFFAADLDLYKFTDLRQLRDREVQLHKTLAMIMGTVGIVGLLKLRAQASTRKTGGTSQEPRTMREMEEVPRPARQTGGGTAVVALKSRKVETAPTDDAQASRSNSKLVAILALIGGSMLFTHVHTVAPYANVAAGVYIAHVVMGLVALAIGGTRVIQDHVTRPGSRRVLAMAFAGFMLAEAVLLITYNEGLPWYIGYGRYNRWGPVENGSVCVAPFGNFRALLNVRPQDGSVSVAFRDRFTNDAVTLAMDETPTLLIARGNEETALPLVKAVSQGGTPPLTGSAFSAHADFLKTAELVSARLVLHLHGKREVGYFDPWVTPLITPIAPNEWGDYKYQCPMHEYVRSKDSGEKCPLCGMEMVAVQAPRPAGVLHDAQYTIRAAVEANDASEARIAFHILGADGKDAALSPSHGQLVHLVVVTDDLAYFDHIHPVAAGGAYTLKYHFPADGRYLVYVDVTPTGDRNQVFRLPVNVTGGKADLGENPALPVNHLALDEASSRVVETIAAPATPQDSAAWRWEANTRAVAPIQEDAGPATSPGQRAAPAETVQAELIPQPRTIYAGLHTELLFTLRDSMGRPITDLTPYIGAMGHCVVISEDTADYLHSHPEALLAPSPGDRGGPRVAFHAVFPKAGRYRVWGQFKRADGRLIIAEFTVEAHTPPVPAALLRFLLNE